MWSRSASRRRNDRTSGSRASCSQPNAQTHPSSGLGSRHPSVQGQGSWPPRLRPRPRPAGLPACSGQGRPGPPRPNPVGGEPPPGVARELRHADDAAKRRSPLRIHAAGACRRREHL